MRQRDDCGEERHQPRENTLVEPPLSAAAEPVTVVIFGATGDLTARKLVPAIFCLAQEGFLSEQTRIVGFARRDWTDDYFRERMAEGVAAHGRCKGEVTTNTRWEDFASRLSYHRSDFSEGDGYKRLDTLLKERAAAAGVKDNRLYYLSAPPGEYEGIIENLGLASMTAETGSGFRRVIIEKPFGSDLSSAKALNDLLSQVFDEKQVYRIDHYLGKETVQNILVLRFANAIFEPIWNRQYVDHVQISVSESVGVGARAGFYDNAGIVRDIFQNHLLQVLSLIAMEPPVAYEADAIRDEKVKVLRAIRPMSAEDVRRDTNRGQYTAGVMPDGSDAPGYLDEERVDEDSQTATYAAMKWQIDNWRWQGVPFYLRSGKRLPARATEVSIQFKRPPHLMFNAMDDEQLRANILTMRIQPDEGISLSFEAKLPGQGMMRESVLMDFSYCRSFGITEPPEAYERLLLDALLGDPTLFTRSDEIEIAWSIVDPILSVWEKEMTPVLEQYPAGTWGPPGADALITRDGRIWRNPMA